MSTPYTNIQQGPYAIVFGAPNADIKFGGGSTVAGLILSNVEFQPTAEEILTPDAEGKVANITTYNAGATVTLSVKFKGSTKAAALAEFTARAIGTQAAIIDPGTTENWKDGDISAATTGKQYTVTAFTKTSAPGQPATAHVTLRRFDSITDYTPLT